MDKVVQDNNAKDNKNIEELGEVKISDDVVASIAGLAASEVKGVASMAGNITNEIVGKFGVKNSSKGVKIEVAGRSVFVSLYVNILYGSPIPKTCAMVQEKVKSAIENMTGLEVSEVNVHIVGIAVNQ